MPNTPAENEYLRDWRARHPDYNRAYYAAHRDAGIARAKAWAAANPERAKANSQRTQKARSRRYNLKNMGISLEYFEEMMSAQEECCAICGAEFSKVPVHMDHDHETGRPRGLLCSGCNLGIGLLRDSAEITANASGYLEGWT
jgi:Recombination endonuclease VII